MIATNEAPTIKVNESARVREYEKANPTATPTQVAQALGINVQRVYQTHNYDQKAKKRKSAKKLKAKQQWKMVHMSTSNEAMPFKGEAERIFELTKGRDRVEKQVSQGLPYGKNIEMVEPPADNVNHPAHYKVGGIETIDFIEAKQLSYNLGNVVKYITRADHKGNREEDLAKARWYLNREIAKLFSK